MTQTPPQQPSTDDPLARLHKMSTTAGVGVGDYVAINSVAVVAVIAGLASAAALLGPVLLAVPVIAIVLGLIAFRQIRRSNGTQQGLALVAFGLISAIAFSGWVGARELKRRSVEKIEREQVVAQVNNFGETVLAGNAAAAWEFFSPTFHEVYDRKQFELICGTLSKETSIGKITSIKSNELVKFDHYTDTREVFAQTMAVVVFKGKSDNGTFEDRYDVVLRKMTSGEWKIERLDTFFPPAKTSVPKTGGMPAKGS